MGQCASSNRSQDEAVTKSSENETKTASNNEMKDRELITLTSTQVDEAQQAATKAFLAQLNGDLSGPSLEVVGKNKVILKFLKERPNYWTETGWLPRAEKRREFCNNLKVSNNVTDWDTTVQELYYYVKFTSSVRQTFVRMCEETIRDFGSQTPIKTNEEMCSKLNAIIKYEPKYSSDSQTHPLVGVPMAALFADVATNSPGMALFLSQEFNDKLKPIIDKWKVFLDSQDSFVADSRINGWITEEAKKQYNFDNYVTRFDNPPYWNSWNDFFTRKYKNGIRPNYGKDDPYAIQLPNDGTQFRYRNNIQLLDHFWLKDMPYSLQDIFGIQYQKYSNAFIGGSIFQSYLDPFNYHCYNSPVSGKVIGSDVLEGAYFPQLVWLYNIPDHGAGTLSLPWLTEVNARGILLIETEKIGLVCLIAIGMGEVSSVNWFVKSGDTVTKGDVVGCFKFGGSSMCVITQDMSKVVGSGAILRYEPKFKETPGQNENITFNVGEVMARVIV